MDLSGLNPTSFNDLLTWITHSINLIISLSALVAVAFLVKAGVEYIISVGDAEKAEKAQRSIIYTLVGMIFVFIAPLVIRFVLERLL